jgi:hypothetical protein
MFSLDIFLSCKLESELRNLFILLPWNVYTLSMRKLIVLSFVPEGYTPVNMCSWI